MDADMHERAERHETDVLTIDGVAFQHTPAPSLSPAWYVADDFFGFRMSVWSPLPTDADKQHAAAWAIGEVTVHGWGDSHEAACHDAIENGRKTLRALRRMERALKGRG